ncbi:MAG: DUF1223 domain-containing protein, partial [Pseudomonadota bacterium]
MVLSVRFFAGAASSVAILGGCALAQTSDAPPVITRALYSQRPVVVETFLSQACAKSPPATGVLQALSLRPDIVALTWHVDYWDAVPAPGVGPWKDPFATPDFGARQIAYNRRIRGRA